MISADAMEDLLTALGDLLEARGLQLIALLEMLGIKDADRHL